MSTERRRIRLSLDDDRVAALEHAFGDLDEKRLGEVMRTAVDVFLRVVDIPGAVERLSDDQEPKTSTSGQLPVAIERIERTIGALKTNEFAALRHDLDIIKTAGLDVIQAQLQAIKFAIGAIASKEGGDVRASLDAALALADKIENVSPWASRHSAELHDALAAYRERQFQDARHQELDLDRAMGPRRSTDAGLGL